MVSWLGGAVWGGVVLGGGLQDATQVYVNLVDKTATAEAGEKGAPYAVKAEFLPSGEEGKVKVRLTVLGNAGAAVEGVRLSVGEPVTTAEDIDLRYFTEVTTIAGKGSRDARGKEVVIPTPSGLAIGPDGTLYIASGHPGNKIYAWKGGTLGVFAEIPDPTGLAVEGRFLYAYQNWDGWLTRFALDDRKMERLAGSTLATGNQERGRIGRDGVGREVQMWQAWDIAFVGGAAMINELYQARQLRRATGLGPDQANVETIPLESALTSAGMSTIQLGGSSLLVGASGTQIVLVEPQTGRMRAIAGGARGWKDGPGNTAMFDKPGGVEAVGGVIYVSDTGTGVVRQLTLREGAPPFEPASWLVKTIAGTGKKGLADGSGETASFSSPEFLTTDGEGAIYVCDRFHDRVRMIRVKEQGALPMQGKEGMVKVLSGPGASGEMEFSVEKAVLGFSVEVGVR
jgi:hypothetical protein